MESQHRKQEIAFSAHPITVITGPGLEGGNYNQILYRLDRDDERLQVAR